MDLGKALHGGHLDQKAGPKPVDQAPQASAPDDEILEILYHEFLNATDPKKGISALKMLMKSFDR